MAKGEMVQDSPTPSSDEYDSYHENMEEIEESMIRKFGKKTYTKIKTLVKKLEKRDRCLEMQGDIITQERDKNLVFEASIAKERMKVETLTVELSLANDTIGRMTKEHSSVNDQIASLKNEKSVAQECLTRMEQKYQDLELNFNTLWTSTSTSPKTTDDSNVSTSNGCKRCYKIDVNACATNLVEIEKKDKEIHRLKMILKNGCKCQAKFDKTI